MYEEETVNDWDASSEVETPDAGDEISQGMDAGKPTKDFYLKITMQQLDTLVLLTQKVVTTLYASQTSAESANLTTTLVLLSGVLAGLLESNGIPVTVGVLNPVQVSGTDQEVPDTLLF